MVKSILLMAKAPIRNLFKPATFSRRLLAAAAPVGVILSATVDVITPLGDYSAYLGLAALVIACVSGVFHVRIRQAGKKGAGRKAEKLGELFSFAIVIAVTAFVFWGAKRLQSGSSRGVLAAHVPQIAALQTQLFDLNKKQDEIKSELLLIHSGVDQIGKRFEDVEKLGGVIPKPRSPEEFFHNAKVYELNSDYRNARLSYTEYLRFNLPYIDPHISYQALLKFQEGRAVAIEIYDYLVLHHDSEITRLARAMLSDREDQISRLSALLEKKSDFAPALYYKSRLFSAEGLGPQTIEDKKNERALLRKFAELDSKGEFLKYFLNKKTGQGLQDEAYTRLRALSAVPEENFSKPVHVSGILEPQYTWMLQINIVDPAKEVFYSMGADNKYQSTGFTTALDSRTGLPLPSFMVRVGKIKRDQVVNVKYLDPKGVMHGPFRQVIDVERDAIQSVRRMLGAFNRSTVYSEIVGKRFLSFGLLEAYLCTIKSIHYSFDKDDYGIEIPFRTQSCLEDNHHRYADMEENRRFNFEISKDKKKVFVRVIFKDSTEFKRSIAL